MSLPLAQWRQKVRGHLLKHFFFPGERMEHDAERERERESERESASERERERELERERARERESERGEGANVQASGQVATSKCSVHTFCAWTSLVQAVRK